MAKELERDDIVTLMDEQGLPVDFEFLDIIEYRGSEYVVLFPADDENAEEVVILKIVDLGNDEEEYIGDEDQTVLDAVFGIFRDKHKHEFIFSE